jgi:hypothetical protein
MDRASEVNPFDWFRPELQMHTYCEQGKDGWAILSRDNAYRYALYRRVQPGFEGRVLFVMLNPSTADGLRNDNTIRACIRFTRAWNYEELLVANLYAYRSRDPRALTLAKDPRGPLNDEFVRVLAGRAQLIVAAWGMHAGEEENTRMRMILSEYDNLYCLGETLEGKPRHPLFIPTDRRRQIFSLAREKQA